MPITQPTNDLLTDISMCVRSAGIAAGVLLGDDLAVVQDQETVGEGVADHLGHGRRAAVQPPDHLLGIEPGAGGGAWRPDPRPTRAVGTTSRRCWNDQRLCGAFCQLVSVQRLARSGGKPIMVIRFAPARCEPMVGSREEIAVKSARTLPGRIQWTRTLRCVIDHAWTS